MIVSLSLIEPTLLPASTTTNYPKSNWESLSLKKAAFLWEFYYILQQLGARRTKRLQEIDSSTIVRIRFLARFTEEEPDYFGFCEYPGLLLKLTYFLGMPCLIGCGWDRVHYCSQKLRQVGI